MTAGMTDLFAPISGESPAGESLRYDAVYDRIKSLREEDDATLPQGVWKRELKRADWAGAAAACSEALATRTKDLQIAAWLTEAWVRLDGVAGVERGLRVIAGLCRDFWDVVHPLPDEGNIAPRLAPIVWVVEKLVLPLRLAPLTAPASEDGVPASWSEWEVVATQAKFQVSVSLTPAAHFVTLLGSIDGALAAAAELESLLRERCGDADAPTLTPLRTPLNAMRAFFARVVEERRQKGEITMPEPMLHVSGEEAPSPGALRHSLPSGEGEMGRIEAYRKLGEAADYLMRTEPHSPVPYLVRRAIAWGNLSLPELLDELLNKNADLATVYTLLGIRKQI